MSPPTPKARTPVVGMPTDVELYIGGRESAFSVRLIDGRLVWRGSEDGADPDEAEIVPTPDAWAAFGAELDRIGVWRWKRRYVPDGVVVDGTDWSFTIVWRERLLWSSGSNAYPGINGERGAARSFPAFLDAVTRLVGGREFW